MAVQKQQESIKYVSNSRSSRQRAELVSSHHYFHSLQDRHTQEVKGKGHRLQYEKEM